MMAGESLVGNRGFFLAFNGLGLGGWGLEFCSSDISTSSGDSSDWVPEESVSVSDGLGVVSFDLSEPSPAGSESCSDLSDTVVFVWSEEGKSSDPGLGSLNDCANFDVKKRLSTELGECGEVWIPSSTLVGGGGVISRSVWVPASRVSGRVWRELGGPVWHPASQVAFAA